MNFLTRNQDTEFHFMVDIETLATTSNAAITEIGAVNVSYLTKWFYHAHCIDNLNGEWNQATLDWRKENNLPWYGVGSTEVKNCKDVLIDFFESIQKEAAGRRPILWCKGTDFDAVIITNAARRYGIADLIPWKYNDINDVRTLLRLFPQFKVPRDQVKHNGLEDAIMQWTYLEKIANYVANLEYQCDPRVVRYTPATQGPVA